MGHFRYKPWRFFYDTNGDGFITISDVINWLIWLFFLPGDSFLYFIMTVFPRSARCFEISYNNYHGFISGLVSFIVWAFIIFILLAIKVTIDEKKELPD
jgi:large-conductance mechanosensitive channel